MRLLLLAPLLFLCTCVRAQNPTYDAPLRGPLLVTGTFGELRSDHFHAGLDFRAPTGTPVYAVADGYVSRIKVSPGGYGQAIYVDHPDGHRSVYGHLETLHESLLDSVRARQYIRESFSQDMKFDSTFFRVERGQRIGNVGNRGHSFGSHLHFEIREQAGDVAVNPLAFGFDVPDRRKPAIRKLRVYAGRDAQTLTPERISEGRYLIRDTVMVSSSQVGFALKAYDRQDAMPNWNGIYGGRLLVDSAQWFDFAFDRIPFEDTEYINALTDYEDWTANTSWFHRFYALSPRQFMARPQDARGEMPKAIMGSPTYVFRPGAHRISLSVRDFAGNESVVELVVKVTEQGGGTDSRPHNYFLPAGERSIIDNGDIRLDMPEEALYEDLYFRYARLADNSTGRLSDTYQLHDHLTPLHGRARLAIRPNQVVPEHLRKHAFLGSCNDDGSWSSNGGSWTEDGYLEASIGTFGDYALFLDTIPPTVEINYFATDQRRSSGFSLLMTDNVSGRYPSYRATIDGKWVLLEHDGKNDKLTYNFADGDVGPGEHLFEITVDDGRGNATVWRRRFRR